MITKADVLDCMMLAVAAFPTYNFDRPQVEAYYECLGDLEISKAELFEAVKQVVQTSSYFPTVAAIRDYFKKTIVPPTYNALEFKSPNAVVAPDFIRELKQRLRDSVHTPPESGL